MSVNRPGCRRPRRTPTAHARHVLRLARRHLREVQAAQHTGRRHRAVGLPQIEPVPGEAAEPRSVNHSKKQPRESPCIVGVISQAPGMASSRTFISLPRSSYRASMASFIGRHQDSLARYQSMVARRPSLEVGVLWPPAQFVVQRDGSMAYRRSWPARSVTWSKSSGSRPIIRSIVRSTDRLSRSPSAPMRYVRPI